jgi:hypothetical protein
MDHLRRLWLAGVLVLVVVGVAAAPARAQTGNLWELRCLSLGGTFSIKDLGGRAVQFECAGLGFQDTNLLDICRRFPDFRSQTGSVENLGRGPATMRCNRSGVANVEVRASSPALFSDFAHVAVFVDFKCDNTWYPSATLRVDLSQNGATGTGTSQVACADRWVQRIVQVVGGPFVLGRADVTVSGQIQGQLGDRDAGNLKIIRL